MYVTGNLDGVSAGLIKNSLGCILPIIKICRIRHIHSYYILQVEFPFLETPYYAVENIVDIFVVLIDYMIRMWLSKNAIPQRSLVQKNDFFVWPFPFQVIGKSCPD
jgi:hypothetical protein